METEDKQKQDNGEIGKEPDKMNPEDLLKYIQPFTHLFNKKKFEKLLERREWDHEINLTEEAPRELNAKAYAITLKEEEALNQWLDEQLKAGLIVESKSRYAAPCFYIPKKDGLLRLVQDYRKLNQVTIKDKTPLPLIGEVIDKLKEAKYFNKLDLIWGYNNVQIKKGDKWKAAFLTNKELFKPRVMYFGLCNLPGTFQRMMNSIFRELLHEGVLANYMDNFIILARTMEELEERTIQFLKIAEKHNLCFKQLKCDFNMEGIPILGVVAGKGQVRMEQEKIKAVKEWKTPMKIKDVESFLRFANFYRRFIHNFSHTARPLNELKGKKEWKWEKEHQEAFEELKEKIMSQPVLSLPKRERKFRVETDASGHAIGGVLSQEQDGKWKPIAFLSRTMQAVERNYEIYDKKLLAIVEALAKWRQYLLDAKEPFEVWTNHENLKYFREPHKLNRRQARWYLKLQDYDFTLKHIPGKTNMKADILSRKDQVNTKEDNKDVQLLKDKLWQQRTTAEIAIMGENKAREESGILKEIRRIETREKEVIQALERNDGTTWEEDGLVYMEGRIYVPNNKKVKEEILRENHDAVDVGHPEKQRMLELLKRNYWWLGLKEDVKRYVQGCFKCQQNKVLHQRKASELHPLEIPQGPWQEISINIIGPLLTSNGMDAIVVIVDRFTKMICLKATTTNISSEGIAKIYRDDIWKLHEIPRKILSDRGSQFTSKFMEEFTRALGTKRQLSTVYHPQTDSQTERINQEIGTFLRHYVNYQQDDWTNWLAAAEFQYNDKKHAATGKTPFELNFGRHPWKGDLIVKTDIPRVEDFLSGLQRSWEQVTKAMEEAQKSMKKQFDKKRRNPQGLKVGDHVWLENINIHLNQPSKKLDNKRYGPFKISKDIRSGAFELELSEGWISSMRIF